MPHFPLLLHSFTSTPFFSSTTVLYTCLILYGPMSSIDCRRRWKVLIILVQNQIKRADAAGRRERESETARAYLGVVLEALHARHVRDVHPAVVLALLDAVAPPAVLLALLVSGWGGWDGPLRHIDRITARWFPTPGWMDGLPAASPSLPRRC